MISVSFLQTGRAIAATLLGLFLTALATAQDITVTVAPNLNGSDNFVDIQNTSAGRLHFYSDPSPSAARMARVNSSLTAVDLWPSVPNFAPDPTSHSMNRLFQNEFLRVYPKTLPVNTTITIPFSYGPPSPTHTIRVIVTAGEQVTSMVLLDPNPTAAATVRWRATFSAPISGVTAANFAFNNPANISGLSIASVTPDTPAPSSSWTITANTGTGNGILGLRWVGFVSEMPPVPNSFTGFSYDFQFAPIIVTHPSSVGVNRNTTTTLTMDATLRGGGTPNLQWYAGTSQNPLAATPIPGANGFSYTPPTFTNIGTYQYFCRASLSGNYSDTTTATVTVVDPPQITGQPASQAIYIGQTATLNVTASGTAPQYQWYRGTAPDTSIPVGTNSSSFTTPALSSSTSYWVRVTNAGPTVVNSSTATITVTEVPSLTVTTPDDTVNNLDQLTSLREAIAYANSLGGTRTVDFAPALAGQTITLSQGWTGAGDASALTVTGNLTVHGGSVARGITLAVPAGANRRHFYVPEGASLTLTDLTLTGGSAPDYGGAVWSRGSVTLKGCTFLGNHAGSEGGAIQSWGDSPLCLIENSTFSGNTAGSSGSAVNTGATQTSLRHVTMTANGPNSPLVIWKAQAVVQNSIIAGNSSDTLGFSNGGTFHSSSSHNLLGAASAAGLTHGVNGNALGISPAAVRLGPLASHGGHTQTYSLLPGSPAIDAGAVIAGITADQRGFPRQAAAAGGLMGRYYALSTAPTTGLLAPLSNLESLVPARTLLTPRIDFGTGTESAPGNGSILDRGGSMENPYQGLGVSLPSADNIAGLWDGYLLAPESANYRFTTRSDDGSVLLIDGSVIVNNNFFQGMTNLSQTVFLSAGYHSIRAAHFEAGGAAGMQVSWEKLDGTTPFERRIIEPAALSFGSTPDIGAHEFIPSSPAATPSATPGSGTYVNSVQVSLGTAAENATIRYTTDGSSPSPTHGTVYTGPFTVTESSTVRSVAYGAGWNVSPVGSASVTIQSTLQAWRALHGLAADGSEDLANPSGDGISNLLKYAFNLAPAAGSLQLPGSPILTPGGNAGLPLITADAPQLTVTFVRRKAASLPGVSYLVQTSGDLTTWDTLGFSGATIQSIDSLWERVTLTDSRPGLRRFARVRVDGFVPYTNDFASGPGPAALRGSAVWSGGAIQLTDFVGGQQGSIVLNDISTHPGLNGFTARFNLNIGPAGIPNPADGVSFAVGDLGTGTWGESGPATANNLTVSFDTYNNGPADQNIGIHLRVNGVHLATHPANPFTHGATVPVEIRHDLASGISVKFNGNVIFQQLATPGFTYPADGRFGFGARTGGLAERAVIDDVVITPR